MQVCGIVVLVCALAPFTLLGAVELSKLPAKTLNQATTTKAIEPTAESKTDEEVNRKKKSTTTFCVEIRPSNPYQRPFQVCEPASEPKGYGAPSSPPESSSSPPSSYYSAPSYEESKPSAPKPAYVTSIKSYTTAGPSTPAPTHSYSPPKAYGVHVPMSYNSVSYRAGEETEETEPDTIDDDQEDMSEHLMRSHKLDKYEKKGHNGLVITCQPSLAGYAAPAYPSYAPVGYGYRSSTPRAYGRPYSSYLPQPQYRPQSPKPQKPSYPVYAQPPHKPVAPAKPYSPPPPQAYGPPPSAPVYGPPPSSYAPPAAPVYAPPAAPVYAPPPIKPEAPTYAPVAPSYAPPPAIPTYGPPAAYAPPPAKPMAPAYAPPAAPVYAPPPPPPSAAPVYQPPPTYRQSQDAAHKPAHHTLTPEQMEQTIKTMRVRLASPSKLNPNMEWVGPWGYVPTPEDLARFRQEAKMREAARAAGKWGAAPFERQAPAEPEPTSTPQSGLIGPWGVGGSTERVGLVQDTNLLKEDGKWNNAMNDPSA